MLSYRHGFHAGNAADVLKHMTLIFCLEYLVQKEKPLLCVDTHAGAGLYPLQSGFAAQNREWENGLGKLLYAQSSQKELPAMLRRYCEACIAAYPAREYHGSPLVMARLLRPVDRLVCFELHPADFALCKTNLQSLAGFCRTEVYAIDGFSGLKGLLPPPSRRGLVLVDPPYELKGDYDRVRQTAAMALKRFAAGTYIIWYPLLRDAPCAGFPAQLVNLYQGKRCKIELYTAALKEPPANSPRGMYGSGLVLYNPPWTLEAALEKSLPVLAALTDGGKGGFSLEFSGE